jgi:hypothetical protein
MLLVVLRVAQLFFLDGQTTLIADAGQAGSLKHRESAWR